MLLFFFKPSRSSDGSTPPTEEPVRGGVKPIEFSYTAYKKYQKILREKYEKRKPVTEVVEERLEEGTKTEPSNPPLPEQIFEAAKLLASSQPKDYSLELLNQKLQGLERLAELAQLAREASLREELFILAEYERLKQQTEEAHRKLLLLLLQDE